MGQNIKLIKRAVSKHDNEEARDKTLMLIHFPIGIKQLIKMLDSEQFRERKKRWWV